MNQSAPKKRNESMPFPAASLALVTVSLCVVTTAVAQQSALQKKDTNQCKGNLRYGIKKLYRDAVGNIE